MNVLLTGCAGFIGWKTTELLLNAGHTVVGVDNLNDSYDVRIKHWRLSQLEDQSGFVFHRTDITDRVSMEALTRKYSFDAIINLAARAGIRKSVIDPWIYYETNVIGTLNLLELCRAREISKFVQASTSSVYGDGTRPFCEHQSTDRPLSPYAASKKAAENLCCTYHHLHGLDVTVLRYFTVYGPAGRPDMAMFRFVTRIQKGEPIYVYGDGLQQRDFTYVEDIACGTVLALKRIGYEVVNLGNSQPVSLAELIRLIEELLSKKARMEYGPVHSADVQATWADISKAEGILGWRPHYSLQEGVARTVSWHLKHQAWVTDMGLDAEVW